MTRTKVVVKQDEEAPIEKGVLAEAIIKISAAAEILRRSGLSEKAIIVLLADKTKIAKGTIEAVLNGLTDLRREYTR